MSHKKSKAKVMFHKIVLRVFVCVVREVLYRALLSHHITRHNDMRVFHKIVSQTRPVRRATRLPKTLPQVIYVRILPQVIYVAPTRRPMFHRRRVPVTTHTPQLTLPKRPRAERMARHPRVVLSANLVSPRPGRLRQPNAAGPRDGQRSEGG